ncbi:ArsJ-associated glyceraldehyde-3-phosphate dehydrogenase [Gammaproteobacteria bacterium AB-CW1]|uniref:Glyceraldehyde-3-phosphate dehydrogenase n=1 Tax=Natronospira elongata TaxID=3110268 RepID=A0AAP6JGV4_9GAMM|nr:ArsJ-associated glyceraldehyde-3-phosphate dehydrogenase [Gammaproteobacteria bacterium AB-CW1]
MSSVIINGFGRMGRLCLRHGFDDPDLDFAAINDPAMDAPMAAHLLAFDSIHGRWDRDVEVDGDELIIDRHRIRFTAETDLNKLTAGAQADIALECSGQYREHDSLAPWSQAVGHVVVSAPVKGGPPNIVVGVNDGDFDPARDPVVSAASCTTNCLAPVVKVVQEQFGIRHGVITTIHDATNTQQVIDSAHKDFRRARATGENLIPTTTGSAKAITTIFPALEGRLNGMAVRVPILNSSLTDAVFELESPVDENRVNEAFRAAAQGPLNGILGYEERPLVSSDYRGDRRSTIVDAASTMVVDDTQLKVVAWYDNETGYVCRMLDLARRIAHAR